MISPMSEQFEERFIQFGVDVISFTQMFKNELPFSVIDQVIRSSTSIGANYCEAQNASSRSDFRNKIFIAKKEAAETRYWLKVIGRIVGQTDVQSHLQEAQEILLILQKVVNTLRSKIAT
jgi:four helix bundle protein